MGVVLVVFGVVGYSKEKRRHGPEGVRRFLIWYCFAWLFVGVALCGLAYPKQRWLEFVELAVAAVGYSALFFDRRRRRARASSERGAQNEP